MNMESIFNVITTCTALDPGDKHCSEDENYEGQTDNTTNETTKDKIED